MARVSRSDVRPPPSDPYGHSSRRCGTTTQAAPHALEVARVGRDLGADAEARDRLREGRVVAREVLADGEHVRLAAVLRRPGREVALVDPEQGRRRRRAGLLLEPLALPLAEADDSRGRA